jgi:hypothetical protein
MILQGAEMFADAQSCHVTSGGLQLFAELHGETEVQVRVPLMIYPSHPTVTSDSELETLRKMSEQQEIGELVSTISAHKMEADVYTLIKLHSSTLPHTNSLHWITPVLITVTVSLVLIVVYHFSHTCLCKILKCSTRGKTPEATAHTTPDMNPSTSDQPPVRAETTLPKDEAIQSPSYTTYAIRQEAVH